MLLSKVCWAGLGAQFFTFIKNTVFSSMDSSSCTDYVFFFAHRSFYAVLDAIKKGLKIDQQKETGKEKVAVLIRNTVFDWDTLSHAAWFPFIAIPGKIMIHRKNESNLRKVFSVENLLVLLTEKAQKK